MGILIEVQQGMVNRGANMSELSQCAEIYPRYTRDIPEIYPRKSRDIAEVNRGAKVSELSQCASLPPRVQIQPRSWLYRGDISARSRTYLDHISITARPCLAQISEHFFADPHECEILFGPLTGIEVLGVRVEASVIIVECAFSINLTALTLEQVLGYISAISRLCLGHISAISRLCLDSILTMSSPYLSPTTLIPP